MKQLLFIVLFLVSLPVISQQDALVFFVDKADVDGFLSNPENMLTQEALNRKNNYGTPIDFRDVPVNENYISTLKNNEGISVLSKSKWLNAAFVRGTKEKIDSLLAFNFVKSIEFSAKELNKTTIQVKRTSKFYSSAETIPYVYGDALNQTEMIAVDQLHLQDFTGEGMIIAVMDSGFPNIAKNPAFSALNAENRLLGTYDFVDRQENINGTGTHGSETLSAMAGYLTNDFVGTAPNASYYLFRTESETIENPVEEAWWVEALERADSLGVDVVNTSLGYRDFDNPAYNHSYQDLDGNTTIAARGAAIALQKGLLLVSSAGNGAQSDFKTVGTPADSPSVLTVGAVDGNGNYASFSSTGPTVDGRIKPDIMAQGQATAVIDTSGQVDLVNGTSFSSPIIAGAVACLWQALPDLKNVEIMGLVRESASQFQNPTDEIGYGIPDFQKALNNGKLLEIQNKNVMNNVVLQANPVGNWVVFSLPEQILGVKVQFFDLIGNRVLQAEIAPNKNRIDVSSLTSGIYLATIKSDGKYRTFKIIKR